MSFDPFVLGENLVYYLEGEKTVFVKCDPTPVDFTTVADSYISVITKKASLKVPIKEQLDSLINLISLTAFAPDKTVVAWDIKPLVTYLKSQCLPDTFSGLDLSRVYDLKLAEAACGVHRQPPATWGEAVNRLKACTANAAGWRLHRRLHLPLALSVIPAIETCGVVDSARQKSLYPSYTIEGQVHGRMSCHESFARCINPHSLDDGIKAVLVPKPPFDLFVQMDYRAMEARVLAWLSQDPLLLGIVSDQKKDVYEEVYKIVTDSPEAGPSERNLAKLFFLPVFFGQQAFGLSESIGVSKDTAQTIIGLIAERFPVAWAWSEAQVAAAEADKKTTDVFGRTRFLESGHQARSNNIAAPAAAICLDKLVRLHKALDPATARIAFSIHDGYVIATTRSAYKAVVAAAKKTLEAEDEQYKGLVLKTSCEIGKCLGKMVKAF